MIRILIIIFLSVITVEISAQQFSSIIGEYGKFTVDDLLVRGNVHSIQETIENVDNQAFHANLCQPPHHLAFDTQPPHKG